MTFGCSNLTTVNEDVLKFLKTRGIEHQTTAPHNPKQNGKAEREIRTLTEMMRAMIFGRKLPKFLWCYAVVMAADILNKTMTRSDGMSPYKAWTGEKPDNNTRMIFGFSAVWCTLMYQIRNNEN